jgi:hypothetical protein
MAYLVLLLFSAPPEGERKLYLAIESTAELAVQKAKVEITRLLKVIYSFFLMKGLSIGSMKIV